MKDQKIELVVFDMAGTTVDEDNVVYKTLRKAINKTGFDFSLEFVLEHGAGKEKKQAIIDILAEANVHDTALAESAFEDFKGLLKEAYDTLNVSTYEGTKELFDSLRSRGIKVALNTGYDAKTANLLIDKLGWETGRDIDLLITASDVENGRPNADMITLIMDKLQVSDAHHVVKVGDSIIDIEEGKNAHCIYSIGVTTGAHTREQLLTANPEYIIDSLKELESIL
ncbi:phosphonatase-like hydrolase [Zhouia amylolytica]|uniref:Phosphonatase-like hydrolase n=1 Tax=Zhouia amylolytica TaxID=376730 RepID=A0A1I6PEB8_9FLAO|nr:phosphonatase-like hydrolase [Zhouia amylolytica]MCQ0111440.1 phosphonatase-like hydrolase [Zhouia amylolytica]SFS38554.1 phosphonatase-like hydrolase [Zhouia amylolytica]